MEKRFAVKKYERNGIEYMWMKSDVFIAFFNEIAKHSKKDELLVNEINKRYNRTQKIKWKRIRLKKEKEVLTVMYNFLFIK